VSAVLFGLTVTLVCGVKIVCLHDTCIIQILILIHLFLWPCPNTPLSPKAFLEVDTCWKCT